MSTLFDVLYLAATHLKPYRKTALSSGASQSDGTVNILTLDEPAGFFDGGTMFFLTGTAAGRSARIINQTSSGQITYTSLGVVPAAGHEVFLLTPKYPRDVLIEAVNSALASFGEVTLRDETLLTVKDQKEYTLPNGVTNIKRVQIRLDNGDPVPTWSAPIHHWTWLEWENKIVFADGFPIPFDNHSIRIWYSARHPRVSNDTDNISDSLHPDMLGWEVARQALMLTANIATNTSTETKELVAFIAQMAQSMRVRYPPKVLARDPKFFDW